MRLMKGLSLSLSLSLSLNLSLDHEYLMTDQIDIDIGIYSKLEKRWERKNVKRGGGKEKCKQTEKKDEKTQ